MSRIVPLVLLATLFAATLFAASLSYGQASPAPGRAPLRVGIVGLVHGHVHGFLQQSLHSPEIAIVGVAEPDKQLLAQSAARYGFAPGLLFTDLEDMIAKAHPQAVLVYTNTYDHRHVVEICARHGVHVMMEKPLAVSLEDALAIEKAAHDAKIHVLVNYETTWYASNRAAFDELQDHRIGVVRRVVVHDGHEGPKEIHVGPEFMKWLGDPQQNGAGALYDFGCYGVDLMTWLMHGETPLTVTAVVNHDKPQLYPLVDDDATIVLAYPHAQAVIQASWNWPFGRKDMEVYGATGYAITVGADQMRIRHQHDAQETLSTASPLTGAQRDSLSYLAAVLHGELEPKGDLTALDTNVKVMQILDAARESARAGKSVKLTKLEE